MAASLNSTTAPNPEHPNGPGAKDGAPSSLPVGFIRQFELADRVRGYAPDFDEDLLNRAYVFAMKAHGGQTRKSGDPYFTHPLAVAAILTELKADPATVITALLHDTVEDTDTSLDDIRVLFGDEIAQLVDGVTKLSQIELRTGASKQAENFRKLVMAMADDVRVLLVKLADRLHNMRTLHFFSNQEKKERIARETLEIYAPLAGRIGIQRFRDELDDLSFRVLNPQAYDTLARQLDRLHTDTVKGVVELAQTLRERLSTAGLTCDVMSREKRPYSIWRKMEAKNLSFEELADIYAFRVIVDTIDDCYQALGIIHTRWRMIPSEFDDYISVPKPNNYQSIHTAVVGPPGAGGNRQRIEIQIRTRTMHDHAERGAAAHWRYKDPGETSGNSVSQNLPSQTDYIVPPDFDFYHTPRNLQALFQGEDPDEALKYAKLELFQDQVFCFTPKGRVIALPKGSSALDFAYAVHTDIGDSCIGVEINKRSRPLRTALTNGDVVRVLRADNARPPAEWEDIAFTGRARTAIRRRLKELEYSDQIAMGRRVAESAFSGAKLDFSPKAVKQALERLNIASTDEVLAQVGRGDLSVTALVEAIYPGAPPISENEVRAASAGALVDAKSIVAGITPGFAASLAPCCRPIPGDRIVGIKSIPGDSPRHLHVHTIFCKTLARRDPALDRWVDLRWRSDQSAYRAASSIKMTVHNEVGGLSEIASIIARYGVSVTNISFINRTPDFFDLVIDVGVKDLKTLTQLLTALRASRITISVERDEAHHDDAS
ncbi:MAG: bifunctional (p)ppGpp synthetase/guanosine-3',5'-bis(diphosphate) 3'-pyrophosphohydrolase [Pseudomonadota bacterium]